MCNYSHHPNRHTLLEKLSIFFLLILLFSFDSIAQSGKGILEHKDFKDFTDISNNKEYIFSKGWIEIDSFSSSKALIIQHVFDTTELNKIKKRLISVSYSVFDSTFTILSEVNTQELDFRCVLTSFKELKTVWGFYEMFWFANSSATSLDCTNTFFDGPLISFATVKQITFNSCTFNKTPFLFQYSTINGDLNFNSCILPDTIIFFQTRIAGNIIIEPSRFKDKDVVIKIDNIFPIDKLNIRYSTFKLDFDTSISIKDKLYYLEQLLAIQKKIGSDKDIEKSGHRIKES